MVRITLVDDQKSNLIPYTGRSTQHGLFGLAQRLARQKRKPK
ncbi:hypothetical protein FHS25_001536 [Rhizobium laguerreae]|uniref:Uncharacterized protein n=1 Tax=Rhizobium laguerreae TaxID=1076926 RepID=A0ABR6G6R8_9HYPH|nr:hypothetical protein [Rhizobium laguerreae]